MSRIARHNSSTSGTVGNGDSHIGIASANTTQILRASVAVGHNGVGWSFTERVDAGILFGTYTSGAARQPVATLISSGIRVVGENASGTNQRAIRLTDTSTHVVKDRTTSEEAVISAAAVVGRSVGLAVGGGVS